MKTLHSSSQLPVPTLLIAIRDKLKAEFIASLEAKKLFKVLNIISDGGYIFEVLESQKPDYLLIDSDLPNSGGLGFLMKLTRIKPETKVIVYSNTTNTDYLKVFLSSPACGYIHQNCGLNEFVSSLKTVFEWKRVVFSQISDFHPNSQVSSKAGYDLSLLTEREMNVWELLMEAKSEKEISDILCISTNTVKTHKTKISVKFQLKGKRKITCAAMQMN